nr:hypothetical protein CFP56_42685 [Quercus suber]
MPTAPTPKRKKTLSSSLTSNSPQEQQTWCYQPPGLSSFDFRLSVPLLSVSRFYFGAEGALVEFWKELVLVLYHAYHGHKSGYRVWGVTVQAAHGHILVDLLDEIRALRADFAHLHSSSPPPFDGDL